MNRMNYTVYSALWIQNLRTHIQVAMYSRWKPNVIYQIINEYMKHPGGSSRVINNQRKQQIYTHPPTLYSSTKNSLPGKRSFIVKVS